MAVVRHANYDRLPAARRGWALAHQLLAALRTRALGCREHRGSHGPVAELARQALAVVEVRKGKARDGDIGSARDRAAPGVESVVSRKVHGLVKQATLPHFLSYYLLMCSLTNSTHLIPNHQLTYLPGVDALDAEILVQIIRECGPRSARLIRVRG